MPNWCNNAVSFTHADSSFIDRIEQACNKDKLFSEFHPCPKELIETRSGFFGSEGYGAELQKFTEDLNMKYFGFKDWYSWNTNNWGTKWEACEITYDRYDENTISLNFDTAWGPPIAFYEKMCELGFSVDAMYYECGMAFCGSWEDGMDNYYNIEGDSRWVRKHIPRGIDDTFCISEGMAEWEEHEKEQA